MATGAVASEERPLTNGELACFRRCRRKWVLQYHEGWKRRVPVESKAMATGNSVHDRLARWYALQEVPLEDDESLDAIMVRGYLDWVEEEGLDAHAGDFVPERSETAEAMGHILLSKPDLWFDRQGMPPLMVDFKTVTTLEQFSEKASRETQPLHYLACHLIRTGDLAEFRYRVLRRVKRTAQAKPPFYADVPVHHTKAEVQAYVCRVDAQVQDMRRLASQLTIGQTWNTTFAYPSPTGDCQWDCPFHTICPHADSRASGFDMMLELGYERSDPLAHHKR